MSKFVPKALTKLTRYPIIALPYDRRDEAFPRELMIDYDSGAIYVKDEYGNIMELSSKINASSVYIRDENGDIVSLETLLHKLMTSLLDVKEVREMAIFKIPNEAQFDLKSVILKNNLVQIYNFDHAQEDSIPMKVNDRVVWVNKQTFLESAGLGISAESSFDILDLPIQSELPFQSVTISNAEDIDGNPVPDANGAYTVSPTSNDVWTRTIGEGNVFTATYSSVSNTWTITHPSITIGYATVQATNSAYNELTLIENKKQQTAVPSGLELNVFLPESTGDLTYSKIIWKVLTTGEAPVFNFMTTSNGQAIAANNIIWEFANDNQVTDGQPSVEVHNFYTFETWDNGRTWFGRVLIMGKHLFEADEEYIQNILSNYYTKPEVDKITSWEIRTI